MLNLTNAQKNLFKNDTIQKSITIAIDGFDSTKWIRNDKIYQESMQIVESLCDDDNIKFGYCEASEFTIQVADITDDLTNKEITVSMAISDLVLPLGKYIITEVEKSTDKRYKKLKCYDRMIKFNTNVLEWYNSVFPTVDTTVTLLQFRNSLFNYIGIPQENVSLPNDDIIVRKTIDSDVINGIDIIQAICEINGTFGHIDRNGIFTYKTLITKSRLYPSLTLYPSRQLYPNGGADIGDYEPQIKTETITKSWYIPPCEVGELKVKGINRLQIRDTASDVGAICDKSAGQGYVNSYIIEDNFLIYGSSSETLQIIAERLSEYIFNIEYMPVKVKASGIPYLEVGDAYMIEGRNSNAKTILLKRTLSGIQALRDTYETKGEELQPEHIASSNSEIIRLQKKTNELSRTVEGTVSTVSRVEAVANSAKQSADNVATDLENNYYNITEVQSVISQLADSITLEVTNKTDGTGASIKLSVNGEEKTAGSVDITGFVTFSALSTSGQTTINGANITTGKIKSQYIDGTNLTISGTDAHIQVGAKGIANGNYLYLVNDVGGTLKEISLDSQGKISVYDNTNSVSITSDGLQMQSGSNIYFSVSTSDNKTYLSTANPSLAITAATTEVTKLNAYEIEMPSILHLYKNNTTGHHFQGNTVLQSSNTVALDCNLKMQHDNNQYADLVLDGNCQLWYVHNGGFYNTTLSNLCSALKSRGII